MTRQTHKTLFEAVRMNTPMTRPPEIDEDAEDRVALIAMIRDVPTIRSQDIDDAVGPTQDQLDELERWNGLTHGEQMEELTQTDPREFGHEGA